MKHVKSGDLISRSALLDSFDVRWVTEYDEAGFGMEYKAVPVGAIENAPAVDAEPVRHGYWIQNKSVPDYHSCSDCQVTQKMRKVCGAYLLPKYCSNCGCKEDAEVEG